jgi:hypothetical protein
MRISVAQFGTLVRNSGEPAGSGMNTQDTEKLRKSEILKDINTLGRASQASDEGSIPFTRSTALISRRVLVAAGTSAGLVVKI